jgi:hypothetical protein
MKKANKYGEKVERVRIIKRVVIAYPFTKWFSKPQMVLKKGQHFGIDAKRFAQQLRNEAGERGVKIALKVYGKYIALTVWDRVTGYSQGNK